MAITYRQCPRCDSKNVINILYGEPTYKVTKLAATRRIKLGGCCVMVDGPEYYCKDCEHEWNKQDAIDSTYKKIKGLKASVGGFFDGYYQVDIEFNSRKVIWSHREETVEKIIRESTMTAFLDHLKILNLLNWKRQYTDPDVLDGTHWSVELIREGRNIIKSGDNLFPEEWEAFCTIIKRLTGRTFS